MTRLLIGLAAVVVLLTLALGWLILRENPLKDRVVAAEQGQAIATEAGKVVERTFTNERVIYKQAEAAAHDLESLPSGGDDLPADVRDRWLSQLGGLPDDPGASDDHGPDVPPR